MAKILKNNTANPISIADTGITVPASPGSYTIPAQDYLLWAASSNIITHIGNGNLTVNDGSTNLTISDGVDFIKDIFPKQIGVLAGTDATPIGHVGDRLKVETTIDSTSVLNKFEFGNDGRVRTGQESLLFFDQINGNVINPELWDSTSSGMTVSQSNGLITINANGSLTANSYCNLVSTKTFNRIFEFPTYCASQFYYQVGNTQTIEFGFMSPTTNTTPSDGFFFRITSTGVYGVVVVNGVETTALINGPVAGTNYYTDLVIYDTFIEFDIHDAAGNEYTTSMKVLPSTAAVSRLPIAYRVYGGSTASTPSKFFLYSSTVIQMDWTTNKPYAEQMANSTHNFCQINPNDFSKTSNWTNSTAPTLATLSNTIPSYTTLGGLFQFNAVNGANTDYALFAYQVPLGFSLTVYGIHISTGVSAAIGNTANLFIWGAGVSASAASLATIDSWPTSMSPRYIPLGMQSFQGGDNAGSASPDVERNFTVPLVIQGGDYLHIILRVPIGNNTGQYFGTIAVDGYFE